MKTKNNFSTVGAAQSAIRKQGFCLLSYKICSVFSGKDRIKKAFEVIFLVFNLEDKYELEKHGWTAIINKGHYDMFRGTFVNIGVDEKNNG